MSEFIGERLGVDAAERLASAANVEQPPDPGSLGVSSALPAFQFTAQGVALGDAPVQTLLDQGSRVCHRQAAQMAVDVTVIQPTMMNGELMYQVEVPARPGQNAAKRWVAASAIEPSADADAWEYGWWNRETEMFEDPPDADQT